jgi:hypothetical protein
MQDFQGTGRALNTLLPLDEARCDSELACARRQQVAIGHEDHARGQRTRGKRERDIGTDTGRVTRR